MKKLMFAAAALVAGFAMADGITSANVVGYQNKAIAGEDAFTFTVNTFKPVSKEKAAVTLSDMALSGDEQSFTGVELQLFNENGKATTRAYFANAAYAKRKSIEVGWYDADIFDEDEEYESLEDAVVPYGCGMAIVCANDDISIVFNGEVLKGAQNVEIAGGDAFTFTGNCMPVDGRTLDDFALTGDEQSFTGVELQLFNENGKATTRAYYANAAYAKRKSIEVGWYDADIFDEDEEYESLGETPIGAGLGFAIVCANDDIELVVPQALAE